MLFAALVSIYNLRAGDAILRASFDFHYESFQRTCHQIRVHAVNGQFAVRS